MTFIVGYPVLPSTLVAPHRLHSGVRLSDGLIPLPTQLVCAPQHEPYRSPSVLASISYAADVHLRNGVLARIWGASAIAGQTLWSGKHHARVDMTSGGRSSGICPVACTRHGWTHCTMVAGLALHTTPTDRILCVRLREGKNVPQGTLSPAGNSKPLNVRITSNNLLAQARGWRNQISRRNYRSKTSVRVSICVVRVLGRHWGRP